MISSIKGNKKVKKEKAIKINGSQIVKEADRYF